MTKKSLYANVMYCDFRQILWMVVPENFYMVGFCMQYELIIILVCEDGRNLEQTYCKISGEPAAMKGMLPDNKILAQL